MVQAIETHHSTQDRLTADQLNTALAYFKGTEKWYRHWSNKQLIYTDGVKFFAENGGDQGAYWFVDKVACEIAMLIKSKKEDFGCITLSVGSSVEHQALVCVTDGNDNPLARYHIHYTDMQPGDWKFYLVDDRTHVTLLLPSEY